MIVVSGARGNIGSEVVTQLVHKGAKVRALGRDPSKLAPPAGVEVHKADLLEPASLDAAFRGGEKLFLVADAMDLPVVAKNAAAAAKRVGIRHVVMVSSATILIEPEIALGRWHREAEDALVASGLAWTFLRPGNFASNSLRWAEMIRSQGAVFAPTGGQSVPVDPRDIADVGTAALVGKGHEGKRYVVTGPMAMTPAEQVAHISTVLGKPLRFVEVPLEGARTGMLKSGMPQAIVDAIVEVTTAARTGQDAIVTTTVFDIAGHPPRTYAEWVRDHVDAFR